MVYSVSQCLSIIKYLTNYISHIQPGAPFSPKPECYIKIENDYRLSNNHDGPDPATQEQTGPNRANRRIVFRRSRL